ncbi:hypothetical protein H5410_063981 [Solanum commersonii]|uniref:Uncharacterized protein n=1 Tax=Solanum commersonii TaxID=4109 RepID=A0A9J5W0L1_SOLCO|nr:hypothetical protein H5410_063981 [Solanum commersonii]
MGESLTEQCRVEVEGPRVVNFFSRRRSNDVRRQIPAQPWTGGGNYQAGVRTLPGLDMPRILLKERGAFGNADTGGAWLSSARAVRCWVKSHNGATLVLPVISRRKVRDDVKSSCPYALGDTRATMAGTKGRDPASELTPKPVLSSDCRLQLACMKPESLVIAGQPYGGEFSRALYTPPVTLWGWPCPKSLP